MRLGLIAKVLAAALIIGGLIPAIVAPQATLAQIPGGNCGSSSIPCYVTSSGGGTFTANVTEWASGILGAMSNFGTSPGAVLVPGVNAYVTNPVTSVSSGAITNPTSTLTLPSTTTAYTAGNLICSSATVATCNTTLASTSFSIVNSAGGAIIARLRLMTNDSTSTAWGGQTIAVDLWSAAPTFATTGDRASFVTDFATGTAGHLATFNCTIASELADGAYSSCAPSVGNAAVIKLASGASIYWTLTATTGSGTTGASKVFTLIAELLN